MAPRESADTSRPWPSFLLIISGSLIGQCSCVGADLTADPSPSEARILVVADFLHPFDDPAVQRLLDGNMGQRGVRLGAVPMLLAGRGPDHVPGVDLLDGPVPRLHPAAAGRHDERLTQRMGV